MRLTLSFFGCPQSDHPMTLRLPLAQALLGLALTQAPTALWAQQGQQGPEPGSRLTPQQRQQLFPEQKQLWLQHSRARISALQSAERCMQAAQTPDAFKSCLSRERQTNMSLRHDHREAMRALYGRYGIQLPEQPAHRGGHGDWKRQGGSGGPGAPVGVES